MPNHFSISLLYLRIEKNIIDCSKIRFHPLIKQNAHCAYLPPLRKCIFIPLKKHSVNSTQKQGMQCGWLDVTNSSNVKTVQHCLNGNYVDNRNK